MKWFYFQWQIKKCKFGLFNAAHCQIKSAWTPYVHTLLISHHFARSSGPPHSDRWVIASLKAFFRPAAVGFIDSRERWPRTSACRDSFKRNLDSGQDPYGPLRLWSVSTPQTNTELISFCKAPVITGPSARSCFHHAWGAPSACWSHGRRG